MYKVYILFHPVFSAKRLEGTWNFPQVPDSISLGSSTGDDDTDNGDVESLLSSSLPDPNMVVFDPLAPTPDGGGGGSTSGELFFFFM